MRPWLDLVGSSLLTQFPVGGILSCMGMVAVAPRVLWLTVPIFRSRDPKMPEIEAEEAALERIVGGLTQHAEQIRSAVASENRSLAWHELVVLKAFLDDELD